MFCDSKDGQVRHSLKKYQRACIEQSLLSFHIWYKNVVLLRNAGDAGFAVPCFLSKSGRFAICHFESLRFAVRHSEDSSTSPVSLLLEGFQVNVG